MLKKIIIKKGQIGLELITCYIYPSLITCYILNNLKFFKRTFWPPIFGNIHINLRKSKNNYNFHLNRGIMLEIQNYFTKNITNRWCGKWLLVNEKVILMTSLSESQ